jgi:hypothetical protein
VTPIIEEEKVGIEEYGKKELNFYSDEYYDTFIKKLLDDHPKLDKKQLVTKLLS